MDLHLEAQSAQRIRRDIDLGHYREPAEVVAHALSLLQDEQEWLAQTRDHLDARITESMAQIERGEGVPGDQLLDVLADRRQQSSR